jgi:hypothetical protein
MGSVLEPTEVQQQITPPSRHIPQDSAPHERCTQKQEEQGAGETKHPLEPVIRDALDANNPNSGGSEQPENPEQPKA